MASGQKKKSSDYPKHERTREKYDIFIKSYIENKGNGTEAAVSAGYAKNSARQTAAKLLSKAYISEGIKKERERIKNDLDVSIDWRVGILKEVIRESLIHHFDASGNKRPLALQSAIASVTELNKMFGTTENDEDSTPLTITFNVKDPKGDMTITHGT